MSRRASLPGADELFRAKPLVSVPDVVPTEDAAMPIEANKPAKKTSAVRTTQRRRATTARQPSGRERHDEKITVYLSPDELFDLDQARILLRGDLGLAADRGRIVRESLAVIISDLEAKGENSILARRLRGL
jgi:hypothetical protein